MNLLRAMSAVSGMTLASRVAGLAREVLAATWFGAGLQMDAFNVAFRAPNMLRRLFAEGAFSQAFVPVLAEMRARQTAEESGAFVSRVATLMACVLLIIVALVVAFPEPLVRLLASGFYANPEKARITEQLTRITFGYIGLVSLVALMGAVLNVERRFSIAAFAPVLLNVSMIAAAWGLRDRFAVPVTALAVGVIAGGVAQFALLVWGLRRAHFHFTWDVSWRDPNVRRVLRLMVPALFGVSAAQISLLINTQIASTMPTGTVSWLSYADRLMEFPAALLGVAAGTIILPSLVRHHADADTAAYSQLLDWGLRITVLLALPAALALGLLATPLVATLFHHGRFSAADVVATQSAVIAYGVGLVGLVVVKILAPAFYARQEIGIVVRCSLASLVFTQLCNALFILGLGMAGHVALALSVGLGACANALLLFGVLRKRSIYRPQPGWGGFTLRVLAAAAAMGVVLWLLRGQDRSWLYVESLTRIAWLAALTLVGLLVYFGALSALGWRPRAFFRREP
ncbi:MAG: murein biosynthesis integral membrane protein MurJ [Betaproteobacteria bacterium]